MNKEEYGNLSPCLWKCVFYIENEGKENLFGEYLVYYAEYPSSYQIEEISQKYRSDFYMIWKKAHDELVKLQQEEERKAAEEQRKQNEAMKRAMKLVPNDEKKKIYQKFYHVLASTYHPDNGSKGDAKMMQYVNELKAFWGI